MTSPSAALSNQTANLHSDLLVHHMETFLSVWSLAGNNDAPMRSQDHWNGRLPPAAITMRNQSLTP